MTSLDVELRKLPTRHVYELSQILEINDGWKELMSIIPNERDPSGLKYSVEDMRLIEQASVKQKKNCSEILLDEWGTSGRRRPRLTTLLDLLQKAQLIRAADYVAIQLLKGNASDRPETGPLAKIEIPGEIIAPRPTEEPPDSGAETTEWASFERRETACISEAPSEIQQYKYEDLLAGTNGFSESLKLGDGGFGSVYLCELSAGRQIAVKRLHSATTSAIPGDQFRCEILTMSHLSHPNLLKLVGYSSNGPDLCLAYAYMVNGSLLDRLACKGNSPVLPWKQRLDIACGTAEALVYLHSQTPKPLVHRDVKSANVLIDGDFTPKLGDFGLTRPGSSARNTKSVDMTTTVLGTSAYMAPEAFRGDVSVKMDVFSFGVVLLELITGLPPFDEDREGCDLASHVDEVDDIDSLIDQRPDVLNQIISEGMYKISEKCLLEKKLRPHMAVILELLKNIKYE